MPNKHIHENHLHNEHFNFSNGVLSLSNPPSGLVKYLTANIDFETSSPYAIGTIPLGSIVTKVIVKTTTGFNGASATIDIGVSGNQSKYLYSGDYSIATANTYIAHMHEREIAETTIQADIFQDSSTAGVAEIYIEYAEN